MTEGVSEVASILEGSSAVVGSMSTLFSRSGFEIAMMEVSVSIVILISNTDVESEMEQLKIRRVE